MEYRLDVNEEGGRHNRKTDFTESRSEETERQKLRAEIRKTDNETFEGGKKMLTHLNSVILFFDDFFSRFRSFQSRNSIQGVKFISNNSQNSTGK